MDFQDRIDEDLKTAMKARQADRLGVIRMLKSALKNASIEQGGLKLDEASALAVVRKEVKKRQDAIEAFQKGNRPELAEREQAELETLANYLPQPFSEEELAGLVARAVAETGATSRAQMGAVMKLANELAAGRADGKALSQAVAAQLSSVTNQNR
ncbi:MAG: aspartyl-tRNA amidotransferase subunit [Chthoniobacteraceae bacterium]|nr:aspartyl-tRNA amidotransferase subunit [Chthoniobacteraceae bacterium]